MLVLVYFADRLSRRPHRLSRQGRCRHRLPGTASRALPARPALLGKGSRGLPHNSSDRPLMVEALSA
eukprot:833608-Pyramimonas_sp.AAC.1